MRVKYAKYTICKEESLVLNPLGDELRMRGHVYWIILFCFGDLLTPIVPAFRYNRSMIQSIINAAGGDLFETLYAG